MQTQPANRPAPRFQTEDAAWTPASDLVAITGFYWGDGAWIYLTRRYGATAGAHSYAEHELTEAGR